MRQLLPIFAAMVALAGCDGRTDGQPAESGSSALPPGHVPISTPELTSSLGAPAQALLDSGNTAFRLKDFPKALRYYDQAARVAPGHAAPWFGTYMVGQATGDKALADSALRMVRDRAPEMQAHPDGKGAEGARDAGETGASASPRTSPHGGPPPLPHGASAPAKGTAPARSS